MPYVEALKFWEEPAASQVYKKQVDGAWIDDDWYLAGGTQQQFFDREQMALLKQRGFLSERKATPLNPQEIFLIERYTSDEYFWLMREAWADMVKLGYECLDIFMRNLPADYRKRPLPLKTGVRSPVIKRQICAAPPTSAVRTASGCRRAWLLVPISWSGPARRVVAAPCYAASYFVMFYGGQRAGGRHLTGGAPRGMLLPTSSVTR